MNKLDIADEIATCTNQLDNIAELMLINLNNSDISKSKELDRLYFLNDYIKELSNQIYNFSNEIIKEWCQMILINGIPASKELVTIFSMVKGASLENPVKTKDLKRATGLSERMIRDGINNLRFNYSVPIGSIRHATNNGYYFIRNQDDLIATIAPIKAQAKQELNVVNKLKDNLKDWSDERWQHTRLI